MADLNALVDQLSELTVLEAAELSKLLEEKWGVSAAAVAVAGPAAGAPAEEKTEFDVELTAAGEQKIAVIKVVKEALALGLAEAKTLVESAPTKLKDAYTIELDKRGDERGFFARFYCQNEFQAAGVPTPVVQINNSLSAKAGK